MRSIVEIVGLAGVVVLAGCSSSDTEPGGTSGSSTSSGASGGSSGASSSGSSGSTSSSGGSSSSSGGPNPSGIPTTDFGAINAWLQKKEYLAWAKESKVHASAGPHGAVRTYVNDVLDKSLAATSAEHPAGAAAVKELYADGQNLSGWAIMVKTQASSDGGQGWYWYEVFDTKPSTGGLGGQGSSTCTGCHAQGKDYVRIPYPLQ